MENSYFLAKKLPRFVYETTYWILVGLYNLWKESDNVVEEEKIKINEIDATKIIPAPQPLQFFYRRRLAKHDKVTDLKFRNPPPKRQKLWDLEEERAYISIKRFGAGDINELERLSLLRRLHQSCPYTTPSYTVRILRDLRIPISESSNAFTYTTKEVLHTFEKQSLPNHIPDPFAYSSPLRSTKEPRRFYNESLRRSAKEQDMAATGDAQLFEEQFRITGVDASKYDRVARIEGISHDTLTTMTLDINTELWPISVGDNIKMLLASSLSLDGSKDDGRGWRDAGRNPEPNLADLHEYVCHGKCYKFEDGPDGQTIKTYVSFGGLLLALCGPYKKLTPLRVDYVYLLLSHA